MTDPIALLGSPGSPYTRKMLAVLRYRRIPYRFLFGAHALAGLPTPKVRLLPTVYLPDDTGALQAVTDSTPIIRRLERERPGRAVIPADPALAFIDALIEDYGDEWLTKAMFHYRWAFAEDIDKAARVLPNWMGRPLSDAALAELGAAFSARQIGRLRYVGSNPKTGPVIEGSYQRFIAIFERLLSTQPFLFGARPAAADFALFGQLTQLAQFDPTPMALTAQTAPRVFAWTSAMEDLSGLEPTDADWLDPAALPEALKALIAEIGRVYAPLLLANAQALQAGADQVSLTIDGADWVQQPFAYQGKCLSRLRSDYAALPSAAKARVDQVIADTGCAALFAAA